VVNNHSAVCGTADGLGLRDAQFGPGSVDAFDRALLVTVGGAQFISPDTVDLTGQTLTSGPISLSGLDVTVQYMAMQDRPALRTFISLHNPSAAPITKALNVQSNFGSDATTTQITDGTFGNWIVTADNPTTPVDAVNTTVFAGAAVADFDYPDWVG